MKLNPPSSIAETRCGQRLTFQTWRFGLVLALCGFFLSFSVAAASRERCEFCQEKFAASGTNGVGRYVAKDPIREISRYYCESCQQATNRCWACHLPVHPKTMRRLEDGRLLCPWDGQDIVDSEAQALDLYREHSREWRRMLSDWPSFPDDNLHLHLANQDEFLREFRRRPHLENPEQIRGFCHTVSRDGHREHHVYILSGLLKNQFLAVGAHEYGHAWLREHDDPRRQLQADTEEGFCEWLAGRYMVSLGDRVEQARIRRNTYTRGQLDVLTAAANTYRDHDVIAWMLDGTDSWLDQAQPSRVLELKSNHRDALDAEPFRPLPVVPTPVPDRLMLKGVAGPADRRLALINDQSLAPGESGRVRVGRTNVVVRCLEIRERSAWIQVAGEAAPREITFSR